MRTTKTAASAAAALIGLASLVGCGSVDRAGGSADTKKVTLTFANVNDVPDKQLQIWADQVDKDSGGTIKVAFRNGYREGEPSQAQLLIKDVADNKIDGGWTGTRAYREMGMKSFDALLTPLLIDSYDLEGKVFAAGIPTQMLAGLGKLGVHGVGVLPGPLRKVVSFDKPLTSAAAFRGITIDAFSTGVNGQTFTALGAKPGNDASDASTQEPDAAEVHMGAVEGNHYEDKGATSVTGNLNFWPRPLVIFVGDKAWAKISANQRKVLREAASQAVGASLKSVEDEDATATKHECTYGLPMVQATEGQLATLRTALQPVDDAIAEDAKSRAWMEQITALKTELDAPPSTSTCDGSPAKPTATAESAGGIPNGTYTAHIDQKAGCLTGLPPGGNDLMLVLKDGVMQQYGADPGGPIGPDAPDSLGDKGNYQVYRDTVKFDDGVGGFTGNWKFDGKTLTFSNLRTRCDGVEVFSGSPWTLQ
jgi:TRAP-type transport system periplasmic protein